MNSKRIHGNNLKCLYLISSDEIWTANGVCSHDMSVIKKEIFGFPSQKDLYQMLSEKYSNVDFYVLIESLIWIRITRLPEKTGKYQERN